MATRQMRMDEAENSEGLTGQDALSREINNELARKGFLVTSTDELIC
jgi:hypothetical protein